MARRTRSGGQPEASEVEDLLTFEQLELAPEEVVVVVEEVPRVVPAVIQGKDRTSLP